MLKQVLTQMVDRQDQTRGISHLTEQNERFIKIGSKNALTSTFLVAIAFVWYLSTFYFLENNAGSTRFGSNSTLIIITINFSALIASAFLASAFRDKTIQRLTYLKYWFIAGIGISWLFALTVLNSFMSLAILSCVIGVYFGLGMPACMGFFTATTKPQNRAKLGGIIILIIGVGFPILSSSTINQVLAIAASILWLGSGLAFIIFLRPEETPCQTKEATVSYRSILSDKTFLLYLVPWFMFSLINALTAKVNSDYFAKSGFPVIFTNNYSLIENVIAGVAAIAFGILADKKGRKRLAVLAFALLGTGYAALGIFDGQYAAALFYVCVDGLAWGTFAMLFLFTIWGDIAQNRNSEKFYVLGVLPYLFSNLLSFSAGSYISTNVVESTIFPFASFFLFLSIMPFSYAPETLSDSILKSLDLSTYVTKALEKSKKTCST